MENFTKGNLGKKFKNKITGKIGEFTSSCEYPTFNITFDDGREVGGAINSPFANEWEIYEEEKTLSDEIGEIYPYHIGILPDIKVKEFIKKIKKKIELIDLKYGGTLESCEDPQKLKDDILDQVSELKKYINKKAGDKLI